MDGAGLVLLRQVAGAVDGGGTGISNLGQQPDGDFVKDKATGVVFSANVDLAVDEEFTTDWFDTDGWANIEVFINADVKSAPEGVEVDYSDDIQAEPPDVKATKRTTYTTEDAAEGFRVFNFETNLDGARVRYTNNGDATTNTDVIVTLSTDLSFDSANYVEQNTLGDSFVRVGSTIESDGLKIGAPSSLFGDLETIERRTLLDVSSSFGTSTLRDETESTGSGSIVNDPNTGGEIELGTGTTADSTINLRTAAYGRYTPGYSAQAGVGIRLPETLYTEGEARWGYFGDAGDNGSGFYFGYDADQSEAFVARLNQGTEVQRIYRTDWNGFDIESVLDEEYDPARGYIYQIDFSWYGYGIVNFQIVGQTADTVSGRTPRQETVAVHSLKVDSGTSIPDPNEPIRVELENAGNGDDNRLYIGGRQFSVFGEESEERRLTSETLFNAPVAEGDVDGWTHVMSWRRSDAATDANARLDFNDMDVNIDQTAKFALVLNANIGGTTYVLPTLTPADETLLEVSTVGTFNGIGTGRKVWEGSVEVGTGNVSLESLTVDAEISFGQNGELSLLAWAEGGTGEITTTMRLEEDW